MYKLLTDRMIEYKQDLEKTYGEAAEELFVYQVADLKLAVYELVNDLGIYKVLDWIFRIKHYGGKSRE